MADSLTGEPVKLGRVWIAGMDWMPGPQGAMWRAETDSLGWARLRRLPPGTYELGAGAYIHGFQTIRVQVVAARSDTLRFRLPLRLPPSVWLHGEIHYRCSGRPEDVKFWFDGVALDTAKALKKAPRP